MYFDILCHNINQLPNLVTDSKVSILAIFNEQNPKSLQTFILQLPGKRNQEQ